MIIKPSEIKTHNLTPFEPVEGFWNLEFNLNTKQIEAINLPTITSGDNNSIPIFIKVPRLYNGIDLINTNCVLTYKTNWKVNNNSNEGQVDLTETVKYFTNNEESYLIYTWIPDERQTYYSGTCSFSIKFLQNLEEDPYQNQTEYYLAKSSDQNGEYLEIGKSNVNDIQKRYWSISSVPYVLTVIDSGVPSRKAFPSGTGTITVNANWSQNDENADDYIKNRTHYIKSIEQEDAIIDEKVSGETELSRYIGIIVGNEYNVYFDGIKYVCVAYEDEGYSTLGAPYNNINENLPFCIYDDYNINNSLVLCQDEETHSLRIKGVTKTFKTLDKNYLPEDVVYNEQFEKVASSVDELNDLVDELYYDSNFSEIVKENGITEMGTVQSFDISEYGYGFASLGRAITDNEQFTLYLGATHIAPSAYYGDSTSKKCLKLPLDEYTGGQLQFTFKYEVKDIETNNTDANRILYLRVNYTDGSSGYLTIVPIATNGVYETSIETNANSTVAEVFIEQHMRWKSGKIIITEVKVSQKGETTKELKTYSCTEITTNYEADSIASIEFKHGFCIFKIRPKVLVKGSGDLIYIADNINEISQYNILKTVSENFDEVKEEISEIQSVLPLLLSRGITSELVKPGVKTILDFNAAYILVSAQEDIVIRGSNGQPMKDTGGSTLPTGKLCIVILPKETIGETSRRLCYHMTTDGSFDATAKHFYVSNDNTVFTTPPTSNLTVFKVSF